MMSLWDALRMNMMISYQELVRTFPRYVIETKCECVFKTPDNHPFKRHSAIGIMTKPCSHHYGEQHTPQ